MHLLCVPGPAAPSSMLLPPLSLPRSFSNVPLLEQQPRLVCARKSAACARIVAAAKEAPRRSRQSGSGPHLWKSKRERERERVSERVRLVWIPISAPPGRQDSRQGSQADRQGSWPTGRKRPCCYCAQQCTRVKNYIPHTCEISSCVGLHAGQTVGSGRIFSIHSCGQAGTLCRMENGESKQPTEGTKEAKESPFNKNTTLLFKSYLHQTILLEGHFIF